MRILQIHNRYQQAGGEDRVVELENFVLKNSGHEVYEYSRTNHEITDMSFVHRIANLSQIFWSLKSRREIVERIAVLRPDIAHFHNIFPLISPSAYAACSDKDVPVVQTLHNYRFLCASALLYHDGKICETCLVRKSPIYGAVRACYRNSHMYSAIVCAMLAVHHHLLRTWHRYIDVFIALTRLARDKFIQGGIPAERIVVKSNFIAPDPGEGAHQGRYALFVGRLSEEKGIRCLLDAWSHLGGRIPLKVIGDGPLRSLVENRTVPGVEWLGLQPKGQVLQMMKEAQVLVFPSRWYEGFPMTLLEALATGLPVVASKLGASAEVLDHERTGLFFQSDSSEDLAAQIDRAWADQRLMDTMRKETRTEYLLKYTAEHNYRRLIEIYEQAKALRVRR